VWCVFDSVCLCACVCVCVCVCDSVCGERVHARKGMGDDEALKRDRELARQAGARGCARGGYTMAAGLRLRSAHCLQVKLCVPCVCVCVCVCVRACILRVEGIVGENGRIARGRAGGRAEGQVTLGLTDSPPMCPRPRQMMCKSGTGP